MRPIYCSNNNKGDGCGDFQQSLMLLLSQLKLKMLSFSSGDHLSCRALSNLSNFDVLSQLGLKNVAVTIPKNPEKYCFRRVPVVMSTKPTLLLLIPILLLLFEVCSATQISNPCPGSSCGSIPNISYPFRLKNDPKSCGFNQPIFELDCLNNQAILTNSNQSYYVQAISYTDFSIRLVDPGIRKGNLSSCPVNSNPYNDWPIKVELQYASFKWNVAVLFIHCLSPVNSVKYVKAAFCGERGSIFWNSTQVYNYIVFGENFQISELEEFCTVGRVTWASVRRGLLSEKSSLAGIYDSLRYGFELDLSGFYGLVGDCETRKFGFFDWRGYGVCCGFYSRFFPLPKRGLKCLIKIWAPVILSISGRIVAGLLGPRFLCGFPFLMFLVVRKWRKNHLSMDESIEEFLQEQNNLTPIKYSYSEIKKMTNNFSQRLGEGGCGTVYLGKLRSGTQVAVKMMMGQSVSNIEEFISEVGTIGRIHHVNVVQLIGFCVETSKYSLVYEFLPNGSLDRYLFNQEAIAIVALRYEKMFEIAVGVARGIAYLHHGCEVQILHFDIKPHNILLDENFKPKISDFGLAKLYPTVDIVVNLPAARGTMGYMAPEMFYMNIGGVSYKADVYSFGMLLMELAGRRKNMSPFADDESQIYFPSWVCDQLYSGKEIEMKNTTEEELKIVKKIVVVALWCIQMKPSDRPSMNKVVEMLEDESQPQLPPKPFVAPREIAEDHITAEGTMIGM